MIHYALIVAGGSGSRMGSAVPKQFLDLGGKPVLVHTLEKFFAYSPAIRIILVIPEVDFDRWKALKGLHSFIPSFPHSLIEVPGGATRFQSVRNGLSVLSGEGLVAIHDAVRPLVSVEVIQRSFEAAARFGSGVVTVPAKDSIRQVSENGSSVALDRASLRLVQTPQTFRLSLIKKAFEPKESPLFTDDASVAEAADFPIHLVEGSYENLKITTPDDLVLAEALLGREPYL
ncbi:MAG: 2-C-methyl-D-erythritol 4-phosphate cytidylyltransferase [Sphingobacteriaceae bacterium]|nr:2-C-methyl-D-erythritol 4-phosphate cytidylyltransferase [Cytophagaceae bacterium]